MHAIVKVGGEKFDWSKGYFAENKKNTGYQDDTNTNPKKVHRSQRKKNTKRQTNSVTLSHITQIAY